MQLYILCEKFRALHVVELGLTAGWLVGWLAMAGGKGSGKSPKTIKLVVDQNI